MIYLTAKKIEATEKNPVGECKSIVIAIPISGLLQAHIEDRPRQMFAKQHQIAIIKFVSGKTCWC